MYYYKFKDKYLFSLSDAYPYERVSENEALCGVELYYLIEPESFDFKQSYAVCCADDLYECKEGVHSLIKSEIEHDIDSRLAKLIKNHMVKAVNTRVVGYEKHFCIEVASISKKKTVNVMALGDVGGTLLIGLRLLGGECIESIGIYDRSRDKINRWEYELNQTAVPFDYDSMPEVKGIGYDSLFDCDMFVFCASKGVPPVGSSVKDVRMVQFEENSKLVGQYAEMAAESGFDGIFAVVSDPVDPLCKAAYLAGGGRLCPECIKGYGLGVMNARAAYYAKRDERFASFLTEGRAYGPHGQDLIIANSIEHYDDELSKELTKLAVEANLKVRETGFKPYIAPALSSGAISIVRTLSGKWHYSSNYVGGVYLGALNRITRAGLEIERVHMPDELCERISATYERLAAII